MKKYFKILLLLFCGLFVLSWALKTKTKNEAQSISPEQAQAIAEKAPETEALLTYHHGALASCLERKVTRTCESDYVSCRDNAWVVQYLVPETCGVKTDGRLGMYYLIDGPTGEIVSRYPELPYFQNEQFCRDDADCLGGMVKGEVDCLNFIAAPFAGFDAKQPSPCFCKAGQCQNK